MTDACGCGAPLPIGARFCVRCGAPAAAPTRGRIRQHRAARAEEQRRLWAVPLLFVAPLAAVAAAGPLSGSEEVDGVYACWHAALLLAAGMTAGPLLGWRRLAAGLQLPPRLHATLLALPAAAFTFLAGLAWLSLLQGMQPVIVAEQHNAAALWLALLVAPLAEEWLCRGLLWDALTPYARPATRNAATAVLFAFLHGMNGGYVLELPHRFVGGLMFGWLRCRGDSLWPCVLAHFLLNLAASLW